MYWLSQSLETARISASFFGFSQCLRRAYPPGLKLFRIHAFLALPNSNPTVEAIVFLGTNLGTNKLLLG